MPETVHLHPDAAFVPDHLLTPPAEDEKRHVMRDLAAFLLDRHLRRLSVMRNPLDLRLGRLASRMVAASGYLECGFARASDYAAERLGISARLMQELVQIDRRLAGLPRIAEAFRTGRISRSQVRLLLRVATEESEAAWLDKASRLNVRLLEREVLAARRAASAGDAPVELGDAAGEKRAGEHVPGEQRAVTPVPVTAPEEDDGPGTMVSLPAPSFLAARWEWALEVCRRSAGAAEPAWRCAEFIAADYLAGVPDLAGLLGHSLGAPEDAALDDAPLVGDPPVPDVQSQDEDPGVELFEEVLRGMEEEYGPRGWAPPCEGLRVVLPESVRDDPADDARRLDGRLREAVRLRQNLAWHQGRLLRTFADLGLHRELGFESLGRYCRERLGFGLRRARRLIALERHLLELPGIAAAYRQGAVSWARATALARVADEFNEEGWLRLARSVTVRRLRQEVALAEADLFRPWAASADRQRRRGDPPGIDEAGRVRLRLPSPRPTDGPASDGPASNRPADRSAGELGRAPQALDGEVQTCAAGFGSERVQTCAPDSHEGDEAAAVTGDDAGVQTCAPASSSWTRIQFWAPEDVARFWRHAVDVCRLAAGGSLADWECVARMIDSFRQSWEVRQDAAWQRRYRIFERDGWRCRVPGCSSRRNLQEHHVVWRSQGGGDEDENLVAICATHHLQGIHAGRLRCHRLPDGLLAWELGRQDENAPIARYVEDVLWEAARAEPDATIGQVAQAGAPEAA